jgi:hypothetical protein
MFLQCSFSFVSATYNDGMIGIAWWLVGAADMLAETRHDQSH